ncbi:hypothetical protein ATANTOWER_018814, partial [Ataeniobius toweri]|nr:hypothetical protein [Ataeniobius toweri]
MGRYQKSPIQSKRKYFPATWWMSSLTATESLSQLWCNIKDGMRAMNAAAMATQSCSM